MHYKGEGLTAELALTGIRDMRIGEFVSELVTVTNQKNLFQRVLDIS
jgi:hypothetical protein